MSQNDTETNETFPVEQLHEYLEYVVEDLGGGYVERDGDVFYHVQVERYKERDVDGTLIPLEGSDGE